jgi:hypothetical protein
MTKRNRWILLLWVAAAISVVAMAIACPAGWDIAPCWTAIQSVSHGASPYADGIADLKAYHDLPSHAAGDHPPKIFWYSPLTIPLLHMLALFPGWLLGTLFWCAMVAAFLLQLRAGYQMASERERRWLIFLLPFVAFFPGLVGDIAIVSGNVAYILYGLILLAAFPGWKRNQWSWFYIAVIFASIFKSPMLTLLAFPILVGRRQWVAAGITGATGCLLFAIQPLLWPAQFKEFQSAAHLVFDWTRDFGFGPPGVIGELLWKMHKPYSLATTVAYVVWAVGLGTLLLVTSRRVRRNPSLRELWIPVAFLCTILLNPRVKPYDNAALTVPMLLIAWRALQMAQQQLVHRRANRARLLGSAQLHPVPVEDRSVWAPLLAGSCVFIALNAFNNIPWSDGISVELIFLLCILSAGIWSLWSAEIASPGEPNSQPFFTKQAASSRVSLTTGGENGPSR